MAVSSSIAAGPGSRWPINLQVCACVWLGKEREREGERGRGGEGEIALAEIVSVVC